MLLLLLFGVGGTFKGTGISGGDGRDFSSTCGFSEL